MLMRSSPVDEASTQASSVPLGLRVASLTCGVPPNADAGGTGPSARTGAQIRPTSANPAARIAVCIVDPLLLIIRSIAKRCHDLEFDRTGGLVWEKWLPRRMSGVKCPQ